MALKKSLATLIKLQKTFVDEQRQQLARLLDHLEQIDQKIAQHEIEKTREQLAAKDDAVRATYGAFLKAMIAKSRAFDKERKAAVGAVRVAQNKLAELYEEQKRYETAEANRIEELDREERRLDRIELDEIGGTRHERQRAEG